MFVEVNKAVSCALDHPELATLWTVKKKRFSGFVNGKEAQSYSVIVLITVSHSCERSTYGP